MNDLNFFEPYLNKKGIVHHRGLISCIITLIITLGLIIYPFINIFRINSLKKSIVAMKSALESDNIYKRLDIVEQEREKIREIGEQLTLLRSADNVIKNKDVINDLLLNKIINITPKDVYFNALSLSSEQIQIQGTATSNLAIAHLENNLKSSRIFKDIYIPNISLSEGLYSFSINLALKIAEDDDITQENTGNTEQEDVKQNEIE